MHAVSHDCATPHLPASTPSLLTGSSDAIATSVYGKFPSQLLSCCESGFSVSIALLAEEQSGEGGKLMPAAASTDSSSSSGDTSSNPCRARVKLTSTAGEHNPGLASKLLAGQVHWPRNLPRPGMLSQLQHLQPHGRRQRSVGCTLSWK